MTFEQIFSSMADKAMAKRKGIALPPLQPKVIYGIKSVRFETVVAALGNKWMTARALAKKTKLRTEQIHGVLYSHRAKVESRSLKYRNGTEWRVRGLAHPRPKPRSTASSLKDAYRPKEIAYELTDGHGNIAISKKAMGKL